MSALWENALRRMCEMLGNELGWTVVPGNERTKRWADADSFDDVNRRLSVDTLLERNGVRWVMDAKYKRGFGDEARIDRFQMCAYALAFDANRVSLVYPTGKTAEAPCRRILHTLIRGKSITIDSLDLPMAHGPDACVVALRDHFSKST